MQTARSKGLETDRSVEFAQENVDSAIDLTYKPYLK